MSDLDKFKKLFNEFNVKFNIIKRNKNDDEDSHLFETRQINVECDNIFDVNFAWDGKDDNMLYCEEITSFIFDENGKFIKIITYH